MNNVQACYCVGPQNGEPLCPCQMRARNVKLVNGRWVEPEKDLGPKLDKSFVIPTRGTHSWSQDD